MSNTRVIALALAAMVSSPIAAQSEEAPAPKEWTNTTDLAFVNTSGNTELTTLAVGETLTWENAPWKVGANFGLVYARQDGETTNNLWKFSTRADRELSKRLALFAHVGWERNTFAGFERRFEEGAGLSLKVVSTTRDLLALDAGAAFVQQKFTDETTDSHLAGRVAALYKHFFAEKAWLQQTIEFLPNFEESEDWRMVSETALVAPITKAIALKVGYVVRHENLPVEDFEKTDRIFTSGLQIRF